MTLKSIMTIASVLLVDDHPSMNFLNKLALKESLQVENIYEALNGEEAIGFIQNQIAAGQPLPQVIFLDINMPRMNGWEFLEEYKKLNDASRSSTKIVMLTSSSNPDDEIHASQIALIDLYRIKLITPEIITEVLALLEA